jgi:phage head maturation protease
MSFGFLVTAEDWDDNGDIPLRTVQSVRLLEISIVGVPAYSATSVGLQGTAQSGRTAASNDAAARRRIAVRRAVMEQKLRGIR